MSNLSSNTYLTKSATYFSVLTALVIISAKIIGSWATNSIAMMASLIDSILDIIASIVNLVAVRIALTPPDNNHRFGHDKIQDLAVFAQSIFFFFSGAFIIISSTNRLINAEHEILVNNIIGLKVMLFSIGCTVVLLLYQSYVLKITKSSIIEADRLHYLTDLFTNIVVIASIYLSQNYWFIDSVLGILIALYLWLGSYKIFRSVLASLSDEEFSDEQKEILLKILARHKSKGDIIAVHEFKTRRAGNKDFIQFHLELDGNINLYKAHDISERVMEDIYKVFPHSEIIIHQDPAGLDEQERYRETLNIQ